MERDLEAVERHEAVDYSAETGIYRVSFDRSATSVTEALVSTVGVVSERNPNDLPPLYSVVDPDALEAVIASTDTQPSGSDVHVTFTYEGYRVTVHSYGIIAVRPSRDGEPRSR